MGSTQSLYKYTMDRGWVAFMKDQLGSCQQKIAGNTKISIIMSSTGTALSGNICMINFSEMIIQIMSNYDNTNKYK